MVDTREWKGVCKIHSKKKESESDFTYNLVRDNKMIPLNLKSVWWELFDGAEKVPLKSSV